MEEFLFICFLKVALEISLFEAVEAVLLVILTLITFFYFLLEDSFHDSNSLLIIIFSFAGMQKNSINYFYDNLMKLLFFIRHVFLCLFKYEINGSHDVGDIIF